MKNLLLTLTVLLSTLLSPIAAYGPRGATERILYYYAYLAEEFSVPDASNRKIGVGCPGKNGRCTFNEFCQYIWKAQEEGAVQDNKRPIVTILEDGEVFQQIKVSSLYNRVVRWTQPNSKYGVTGNTEADRVYKGASDYYDALQKVGGPIGDLGAIKLGPKDPNAKIINTIITNGKDTAKLLYDQRFQDLEKYRKGSVAKKLGLKPTDLVFKAGGNTLNVPGDWDTIDAPGTVAALKDSHPNIEADLAKAINDYQTGSDNARRHWAALCAADNAQKLSGCS